MERINWTVLNIIGCPRLERSGLENRLCVFLAPPWRNAEPENGSRKAVWVISSLAFRAFFCR
jgi:hypothetical protein